MWAGGKVANFDRIEWKTIPDPATQGAALQRDEVDWVEAPLIDLTPMLRKAPGIKVEVFDKLGSLMLMAFNFYHPPFDNVKLRRAVLSAVNQEDFVNSVVGEQQNLGRVGVGVFPLASPYSTTAGMEALTGPRDLDKSKRLVAESGYKGEPIVLMVPSDQPNLVQEDQVANTLYQSLGLNVQYTELDFRSYVCGDGATGDAGQGWLDQLLHSLGGSIGREPVHAPAAAHRRGGRSGVVASNRCHLRATARSVAGGPGPLCPEENL